jgi:hypothetical protein
MLDVGISSIALLTTLKAVVDRNEDRKKITPCEKRMTIDNEKEDMIHVEYLQRMTTKKK